MKKSRTTEPIVKDSMDREIKLLVTFTLIAFVIVGTLPYLQFHFIDPLILYAEASQFYLEPDQKVFLRQPGAAATCAVTGPNSVVTTTPSGGARTVYQETDSADPEGCTMASFIIEDSLFPSYFDQYLVSPYGEIRGVIDIDDADISGSGVTCRNWVLDELPLDNIIIDPRENATRAYEIFDGFGGAGTSWGGSFIRCIASNAQRAEGYAMSGPSYTDRVNQTFWSWGMASNIGIGFTRPATVDNIVRLDPFLKWNFKFPVNNTDNWWQIQEHPMYPGTFPVITDGFVGIDDTTFTMDTGSTVAQRGQVAIFKSFNKTELAHQEGTAIPVDNLVAYYTFEESSGVLINKAGDVGSPISFDSAADGTVEAGITRQDSGIIGSSYLFPGSSSGQITLGSSTSQFNFLHNTTAKWTMNFWINSTTTGGSTAVIQNNVGTTANRGINIGHTGGAVNGGTNLLITKGITFDAVAGVTAASSLPNGVWNMVTYTFDYNGFVDIGNNTKVYVNGVLFSDEGLLGDPASNGNAAVALQMGGFGDIFPFAGNLDEFSIWNDELTPSEITTLYNSGSALNLAGNLPDIKVQGGLMSVGTSADLHIHVEIKDGNFQAGHTMGLNAKDSTNSKDIGVIGHDDNAYFERGRFTAYKGWNASSIEPLHSLGVYDLEDLTVGTANNFDISFIPNWENSTEDVITVFVAVQDNSTTGSLIANITSIEIENNVRYNFTNVQDLVFYEPNCTTGMATTETIDGAADNDRNCGIDQSNGIIQIANITTTGSFTEPPPTPDAPTNVVASLTHFDTVELTWDHPIVNVTNFLIERTNGTGYEQIALTADPSDLSFTDSNQPNLILAELNQLSDALGLDENTSYTYRVTAFNGNSTSSSATSNTATTPDDDAYWELVERESEGTPQFTPTTTGGDGDWFSVMQNVAGTGGNGGLMIKSFNLTHYNVTENDSSLQFYFDTDASTTPRDQHNMYMCNADINRFNTTVFADVPGVGCTSIAAYNLVAQDTGNLDTFSPYLARMSVDWNLFDSGFMTILISSDDDSATVRYNWDFKNFTLTNSTNWEMESASMNFTANNTNCAAGVSYIDHTVSCDLGSVIFSQSSNSETKQTELTHDWQYREMSSSSGLSFGSIFTNTTGLNIEEESNPVGDQPSELGEFFVFKTFPSSVLPANISASVQGEIDGESTGIEARLQTWNGTIDRWNPFDFQFGLPGILFDTNHESLASDTAGLSPFALTTLTESVSGPTESTITVGLRVIDTSTTRSGIIKIINMTVGDTSYLFNGSSTLKEEISNTYGGDTGLISPDSVTLPPPHDISEVNATATENDVFLEWAYDLGNETTTETWKYREQDAYATSFEACWFWFTNGALGVRMEERQGCGQEGGVGWVFKSIPTTEVTGSDIEVTYDNFGDGITSTLYIFDGFYNENLTTAEWPELFVSSLPTLKGAGILGSVGLPASALATVTLPASSINYSLSSTGNITVAIRSFDTAICCQSADINIHAINVTNVGFYNFTDPSTVENDYGTPEEYCGFTFPSGCADGNGLSQRDGGAFYVPSLSPVATTEPPTDVSIERKLVPGAYSTLVASLIAVNATAFNNEEYLDETVTADTLYQYRLTPYNGITIGNPTESNQVLTNDVPTAPFNLTGSMGLIMPDLEDVFLTWEGPLDNGTGSPGTNANVTHYWIERKAGIGAFSFLANTTNATTAYEDDTVVSSANYTWRLRAVNPVGFSPYSNEFSMITTPLMPPDAPTNLTATAVSGTQINVEWLAAIAGDPPTDYVLQQRHVGFTGFVTIATIPAPTLFYNVTGLLVANTYDYRVRADNGAGSSAYSNIDQATTFNVPSAPQNLNAVTFNNTRIDLTWDVPASVGTGIINYWIERESPVGGGFAFIANSSVTSYSDLSLTQNTIYNYKVRALNSIGYGVFSNQDNDRTHGVPDAPINLSFTTDGVSSITVDWDSPVYTGGVPLTAYTIDQAQGIGGTFFTATPNHPTTPTDKTYNALLQSTNYIYKIAAKNTYGTGAYSANLTAGTFAGPSEPENFLAVFNSTRPYSVNLSWSVPLDDGGEPILGYLIQRKDLGGVYQQIGNVTNSTFTFIDTNLINLATHTYRIAAYGSIGDFTADQPVTTVVPANFVNFTIADFNVVGDVLRQDYTFVIDDCFPQCTFTIADIERNGIVESTFPYGQSITLDATVTFTSWFVLPNTLPSSINTTAFVTNLGSSNDDEAGVTLATAEFLVPGTIFYNHTRTPNFEDIIFTLVRHPVPWSATCEQNNGGGFAVDQGPVFGQAGVQPILSLQNVGYFNDTLNAVPSLNTYVACFNPPNQILAFTSFGLGNGTFALTSFTGQLGDFLGVPVPFIFIIFLAAIWTGRSASTGIIFLSVAIGAMGVLGYFPGFDDQPLIGGAFWSLIVLLTALGVLVGKRFF